MVLLLVALLVLGPHRLLDGARQAGKYFGEFRRWSEEIKSEVRSSISVETNGNGNGAFHSNGNGSNGNDNGAVASESNGSGAADGGNGQPPLHSGIGPFSRPTSGSES
jgi:Sec-independent protein translocase protein TatA